MPTTAYYTNLPGTLGGPLSIRRGGQSRFVLPDMQGNVRQLTDSTGVVTDTLTTDAFGVQKASSGGTVNPFKAYGQWGYFTDTPSRLYVRARELRVDLGRWVSRDPVGLDQNLYYYGNNRPLVRLDPTGLLPQLADECLFGDLALPVTWQDDILNCIGRFCDAIKDKGKLSRILDCLRPANLVNPDTVRCLNNWCASNYEFHCCKDTGGLDCVNRVPITCETVCILGPTGLAETDGCEQYDPNKAKTCFCALWWTTYRDLCPKEFDNDVRTHKINFVRTMLHELIHICGKCVPPDYKEHTKVYNTAAKCIAGVVGCNV